MTLGAIVEQARQLHFGTALLTATAWLLIGAGKAGYYALAGSWLALAWAFVALRQGWREAAAAQQQKRLAARMTTARG